MSRVDQDQPFSWVRCVVSIISFGLLVSDVVRTGPATLEIPSYLNPLEPDVASSIGPVGYMVNHVSHVNATTQVFGRFWPYKYDTTSAGVRAFAQHFRLSTWSPCVLYRERCDETPGLPLSSVFAMIDSLVEAVRDTTTSKELSRKSITLRIDTIYRDRLHHYVIPWFYEHTVKRTVQATYHQWNTTDSSKTVPCSALKANRPYSCGQIWSHRLKLRCISSPLDCKNARSVWQLIPKRLRYLTGRYPGKQIESVIVDGTDDYSRGGLTFQGFRRSEVVVLSRVVSCVNQTCTTDAVDDYRVEVAGLMASFRQWSHVVALLRVVGQVYIWLRVALLVWVCHTSRRDTSRTYRHLSGWAKSRIVARTIFLVPSQVMVYGSLVPISLYYIAHLIDSPGTYALAAIRFNSLLGKITWNPPDIANYCAVSMRAVWVLSFHCHFVQAAFTKCVWSAARGVPGIAEFVITFIASLTLLAQYRSLDLRNTKVLATYEVRHSERMHQLRSYPDRTSRAFANNLVFGTTVDLKCLQIAVVLVGLVCIVLWALNRAVPRCFPFQVSMISRTLVSYSAGYLWPHNRLVVSWFGSLVIKSSTKTTVEPKTYRQTSVSQVQTPIVMQDITQPTASLRVTRDRGLVLRSTRQSTQAQRELQDGTSRSREIESVIYLMNLAVMTDPITMLRLRFASGCSIGLYESTVTHRTVLLPYGVRLSDNDVSIDWEELDLIAVVNTKDLAWDDLLRVG